MTAARATATGRTDWFRFGDGYLALSSADAEFRDRFLDLYLECAAERRAPGTAPVVACDVASDDGTGGVRIAFQDPEPLDQLPIALTVLDEVAPREIAAPRPGWRALNADGQPGCIAFADSTIVADATSPWQSVVSVLAVHRVLRLQRQLLCFHAASLAVGGGGLLLFGEKGAGKTTLSLALADRGHTLLGDEVAAVCARTIELLPFRRRLSIRPGPASAGVARALAAGAFPVVTLADGTSRTRVHARTLFPAAPAATVPARVMVFLRGRTARPRARPFTPGRRDLAALRPFESATWDVPSGAVAIRLLRLLGCLRCYEVEIGSIDDTAGLLADLMEDACD